MNRPNLLTRVAGSRQGSPLLFAAAIALAIGAAYGDVPPLYALLFWFVALGLVTRILRSVWKMRAYNEWAAHWNAMAGVAPVEPKAAERKAAARTQREDGKPRNIWAQLDIPVGLVLLVLLPWLTTQTDSADDKQILALFWLLDIVALAYGVVCRIRARRRSPAPVQAAPVAPAGPAAPQDDGCVAWLLPPAASAPSRLDAVSELPDYCARMMEHQTHVAPGTR